MTRPKKVRAEAEITVWPSSYPDDIGSIAPADSSLDSDELGSHFLSDSAEHGHGPQPMSWEDETDEPEFDERLGTALLRSFGLVQMPRRTTTRPLPARAKTLPKMRAPRLPTEFDEYIVPSNDVDLTDESIRDVSLMDHEAEEPGEVESPNVRTDDVHTHGKRRGGHASLRPPSLKRAR